MPCAAGTISAQGEASCHRCDKGSVSNPERTQCLLCGPGTFVDIPGLPRCKECEEGLGTLVTEGADRCTVCPTGKYANAEKMCVECATVDPPPGYARLTTNGAGGVGRIACVCPPNAYLSGSENATACLVCGEGLDCKGYGAAPQLHPGYASNAPNLANISGHLVTEPPAVYRCKKRGRCPGGVLGSCAARRIDVACALCELGAYPSMEEGTQACFTCAKSDTATFVAVLIGAFLLTCLLHFTGSLPLSNVKHSTLLTTSVIGILCTLLQAFSVVDHLEIHWSPFMRAIFERMKILLFDPRIFRMGRPR